MLKQTCNEFYACYEDSTLESLKHVNTKISTGHIFRHFQLQFFSKTENWPDKNATTWFRKGVGS